MKNFPQALAFSVAVHVLVACGLLLCPSLTRIPDAPQMELSAVEFMTAQETPKSQEAPPEPQEQQESEPQEQPEPEPQEQQEQPEPQDAPPPEPHEPPEISLPEPPEPQEQPEPQEISLPAAPEPTPEPPRKHPSPTPEAPPPPAPPPPKAPHSAPPPPAAAENTARIDAPPRASRPIRPEYPKEARQRGEEGDVTLDLVITARGLVSEVSVAASSGFRDLDDAAARAAARTKFKPATRGSTPVQANARIIIKFRISGK